MSKANDKNFDDYLHHYTDNRTIEESAHLSRAKSLPEGWFWTIYNDGSGSLKSPDGKRCCSYDLYSNEINYEPEVSDVWEHVYDLSATFKEVGEKYIRTRVLKIEEPTSLIRALRPSEKPIPNRKIKM